MTNFSISTLYFIVSDWSLPTTSANQLYKQWALSIVRNESGLELKIPKQSSQNLFPHFQRSK